MSGLRSIRTQVSVRAMETRQVGRVGNGWAPPMKKPDLHELEKALAEDESELIAPELPVVADEQPREDPLEQWFSKEAIAEVRAWRRGGPVPTSAAGLELMEVYVRVDEDV